MLGLLHRSTGQTAWFMDSISRPVDRTVCRSLLLNAHFAADQLTRLFVARASSPATSVTPRPLDSSCSRTKWAHFTPLHLADIASCAGDSSVLGHRQLRWELLSARTSPATLGTPQCSDIASYARDSSVLGHRQLRRGFLGARILAMSHRCAIKLLHAIRIRVLILGSMSGVMIRACQMTSASFQTFFSLTLLQDSFFIFQQARGLSGHTSPCGECALFILGLRPGTGCLLG